VLAHVLGYIDPQSGSLAVQFLIAAALSAGVVLRNYLFWPVTWALRRFRDSAGVKHDAGN
jgi:hypothetical protein